jgi:hypothetical protein
MKHHTSYYKNTYKNCLFFLCISISYISTIQSYTINQSGTFVLGQNIQEAGTVISITASNVILDLNGWTVTGGTTGIEIASGLSNIIIKNGRIASCNVGISILSNVSSVTISGIEIETCPVQPIQLVGSSGQEVREIVITQVAIQQSLQTPGLGSSCISLNFTTNCSINNVVLQRNGNSSLTMAGINITNTTNCIMENIIIEGNNSSAIRGIQIDTSTNCRITNSVILGNIATTNGFIGIFVSATSGGSGHAILNCTISGNTATGATASSNFLGIALEPGVNNAFVQGCLVSNNSVPNANTFLVGFNLASVSTVTITDNLSLYNTGAATTDSIIGFHIFGATGGTSGLKNSVIKNNIAIRNNGGSNTFSFGLRVASNAGGNIGNIYQQNIGALNGPTAPAAGNQITSTAGAGSSPGGVPSTSIIDLAATTLNTTTLFGNVRIT